MSGNEPQGPFLSFMVMAPKMTVLLIWFSLLLLDCHLGGCLTGVVEEVVVMWYGQCNMVAEYGLSM